MYRYSRTISRWTWPKGRSEKEDGGYDKTFNGVRVWPGQLRGVFRDIRLRRRIHRQFVRSEVDGLRGPDVVLAGSLY